MHLIIHSFGFRLVCLCMHDAFVRSFMLPQHALQAALHCVAGCPPPRCLHWWPPANCPSRCRPPLQVQEASAATDGFWQMPDASINLGNVYLASSKS